MCRARGRPGRQAEDARRRTPGGERQAENARSRTEPRVARRRRERRRRAASRFGGWGAPVAESALAPPGPIPNPVVTQRSAGEYCGGDSTGGEAAAGAPHPRTRGGRADDASRGRGVAESSARRAESRTDPSRGGAAAARWAHNPKVGGSNPSPATRFRNPSGDCLQRGFVLPSFTVRHALSRTERRREDAR